MFPALFKLIHSWIDGTSLRFINSRLSEINRTMCCDFKRYERRSRNSKNSGGEIFITTCKCRIPLGIWMCSTVSWLITTIRIQCFCSILFISSRVSFLAWKIIVYIKLCLSTFPTNSAYCCPNRCSFDVILIISKSSKDCFDGWAFAIINAVTNNTWTFMLLPLDSANRTKGYKKLCRSTYLLFIKLNCGLTLYSNEKKFSPQRPMFIGYLFSINLQISRYALPI